ncbi:MAG: haloacid dehalogenase [Rhodobacteraceae bacterium]|jgi:phosphoglycolate phosphatase|uniref:phosphoglycolate phosphatase n=1 Tax=Salipiger profundus TaxID=1229727 RepID=A0A1U7DAS0_9RHOB|nr:MULTISPECIES: HAD family hydrolase [Salipiger]APX25229.1 phosphoglycolate phosphatase [Salipiger profundus]MAB05564.1 haloacid dehalogenase [Paracoccaceae bacterium]GGA16222.1 phosphoglycolate phosphatase [Salipiger profundus]SFD07543.1 phosphoglycolate phosphatase [Salipiger profundus]
MRTVVFDLDGTLADTSGDLIAAANWCFAEMGASVRLDPEADAATAFRGARAMLRLGLGRMGQADEETVERWYPQLLTAYGEAIDVHTVLYPGAVEAVEALREAGSTVSICTNKPEALAETLLCRLGVRDLFGALVGADTLPVRKPDPAPYTEAVARVGGAVGRSLLVGDTDTDRKTAAAVGAPCILVSFGPDGEAVRDLAPEGVIGHFRELGSEVDRLLG